MKPLKILFVTALLMTFMTARSETITYNDALDDAATKKVTAKVHFPEGYSDFVSVSFRGISRPTR